MLLGDYHAPFWAFTTQFSAIFPAEKRARKAQSRLLASALRGCRGGSIRSHIRAPGLKWAARTPPGLRLRCRGRCNARHLQAGPTDPTAVSVLAPNLCGRPAPRCGRAVNNLAKLLSGPQLTKARRCAIGNLNSSVRECDDSRHVCIYSACSRTRHRKVCNWLRERCGVGGW